MALLYFEVFVFIYKQRNNVQYECCYGMLVKKSDYLVVSRQISVSPLMLLTGCTTVALSHQPIDTGCPRKNIRIF